jgi:hypothetical protein
VFGVELESGAGKKGTVWWFRMIRKEIQRTHAGIGSDENNYLLFFLLRL